ncbi:DNA fragmentation factor CIDE-like protein [Euroglyphus maynei]|uniref:DNAation factor CIDE-like protein n=1 Tax=Euroglyphus maynei TaxID=6958 RepID=A0A1Y3AVW9_EURMA|nr:DNA fragmentation factor CIDE-like protein [Euroglyphus maynei]
MSRSYSNQPRPYKVWSSDRQKRKSITASNLNEFKIRGAEKLGYENYHYLRVVLENDGTEVEDDSYFQSAENDTVFLLLRDNEHWLPPGMDALKSALSAIPQIVCDTINSLKLANKSPAWSIKDDQGFITVTLQWEHDNKFKYLSDFDEPSWKMSSQPSYAQFGDKVYSSTFPRPSSSRAKSYESYLRGVRNLSTLEAYRSALPYKTLSADDFSFIDRAIDDYSSAHDLTSYCDFHCSSLHRDGGSIKVSKSVGTSPILDFSRTISPIVTTTTTTIATTTTTATSPFDKGSSAQFDANIVAQSSMKAKKGHVRFMDNDKNIDSNTIFTDANKRNISLMGLINGHIVDGIDSSDSETETTERDDEQFCERYLILVDQLSANHKKHLSIKDIGIILERLKTKIIDIDKLEKDKESIDCYNWLIKAIIKGDMLREIGVVYNGQYYSLMEHPGYF